MVWIEKKQNRLPVALTIAGSDSGGGAGIQADIKTFAAVGVHGCSAITAITAQNTQGVSKIQNISLDVIQSQIVDVIDDIGVDAIKTGMLYDADTIKLVSNTLSNYQIPLVIDPVMFSKSGTQLILENAIETLKDKLIPISKIITPNIPEAEKLSGIKINNIEQAKEAAHIISKLGVEAVLIKGGHSKDTVMSTDILLYKNDFEVSTKPRINNQNTHGTGCTYSAAITAYLSKGFDVLDSFKKSREIVHSSIIHGLDIGNGYGPVNPLANLYKQSELIKIFESLNEGLKLLSKEPKIIDFIPEVRTNLVYALPEATTISEIASFPGRITTDGKSVIATSYPALGASTHLSKAVIEIMNVFPHIRSCINLKYSEDFLSASKNLGFTIVKYNRKLEPKNIKIKEGNTMRWGLREILKDQKTHFDIVFHLGDVGKEPMINVFGNNPQDVVKKTLSIIENL